MDSPRIRISRFTNEWRQIVAYVEARITNHRQQLESEMISLDKVPAIRARIAELKALIEANPVEEKDNDST